MTVGSSANIASAFNVMKSWRGPMALEPVHRLALLLISDGFGGGATKIDAGRLHHLLGTEDPAESVRAIEWLGRCGLIRLSDWHGDVAFAGSVIATEQEIADARRNLDCHWPFANWTGKT